MEKHDAPVYRYSVVAPVNTQDVVIFTYNYVGRLVDMTFGGDCTDAFIHTAKREAPVRVVPRPSGQLPLQFDRWLEAKCKVKDITNFDLSFNKFWDAYDKKVGNKKDAQKAWDRLPELDKIMAFGGIRKQRMLYERDRLCIPFVTTYLHQRRWENVLS